MNTVLRNIAVLDESSGRSEGVFPEAEITLKDEQGLRQDEYFMLLLEALKQLRTGGAATNINVSNTTNVIRSNILSLVNSYKSYFSGRESTEIKRINLRLQQLTRNNTFAPSQQELEAMIVSVGKLVNQNQSIKKKVSVSEVSSMIRGGYESGTRKESQADNPLRTKVNYERIKAWLQAGEERFLFHEASAPLTSLEEEKRKLLKSVEKLTLGEAILRASVNTIERITGETVTPSHAKGESTSHRIPQRTVGKEVVSSSISKKLLYDSSTTQVFLETRGSQGAYGFQGIHGSQGTQGHQGTQGYQGIHGTQETQGSRGAQDLQGIQGFQGIKGAQGIRDVQGIHVRDAVLLGFVFGGEHKGVLHRQHFLGTFDASDYIRTKNALVLQSVPARQALIEKRGFPETEQVFSRKDSTKPKSGSFFSKQRAIEWLSLTKRSDFVSVSEHPTLQASTDAKANFEKQRVFETKSVVTLQKEARRLVKALSLKKEEETNQWERKPEELLREARGALAAAKRSPRLLVRETMQQLQFLTQQRKMSSVDFQAASKERVLRLLQKGTFHNAVEPLEEEKDRGQHRTHVKENRFPTWENALFSQKNRFFTQETSSVIEKNRFLTRENSSVIEKNRFLTRENSSVIEKNRFLTRENSSVTEKNRLLLREHSPVRKENYFLTKRNPLFVQENHFPLQRKQQIVSKNRFFTEGNQLHVKENQFLSNENRAFASKSPFFMQDNSDFTTENPRPAWENHFLIQRDTIFSKEASVLVKENPTPESEHAWITYAKAPAVQDTLVKLVKTEVERSVKTATNVSQGFEVGSTLKEERVEEIIRTQVRSYVKSTEFLSFLKESKLLQREEVLGHSVEQITGRVIASFEQWYRTQQRIYGRSG